MMVKLIQPSDCLSDFFGNAPVALHLQAEDGSIKLANEALAELLGYALADLERENFFNFYVDTNLARDHRSRLRAGETLHSQEVALRSLDDRIKTVLLSTNVRWESGRFVYARCFSRHIPELKEAVASLAEADARKAAILEASLDAIITMDGDGRLLDFNRAAELTFGYTREQAIGRQLSELIVPPRLRVAHEEGLRRFLRTGEGPVIGKRVEISAMHANGHEFPVELSIAVARTQAPLFTATLRDIAERQRADQKLRDTLTALEESEAALRLADVRKDEFIATLAHELRNPLAPVRTAAEILARPDIGHERVQKFVDIIRRQVAVMARLLDDLLDVARVSKGKLELRRTSTLAGDVVGLAVQTVQPLLDAKGQELDIQQADPALILFIDPVRIAQVLTNLLANASKYSNAGQRIRLRAWAGSTTAHFEVSDDGIGFTQEAAADLFVTFSQLPEAAGRDQGGLGLGLALSMALVKLHGGTLEAASPGPGGGSRFTVILPIGSAGESL